MRPTRALPAFLLAIVAPIAHGQRTMPTVHGRLFADFNYLATERPMLEGFREGQVAVHLASSLTERITFFGEMTASAQSGGFSVEAERFFLRYDHGDLFKLSGGRFHTPISYWNTAYHHGQWLQTSVARPDFVRGGSGLVPLHFVGLLAEGAVTPGPVSIGYTLGVGNGRDVNLARASDAGDANNSRAVIAGTSLRLPRSTGLRLGTAYYIDRLTPNAAVDVDEHIASAYVARERETPEVIVEFARITHDPRTALAPTTRSNAFFAHLAYRLPGWAHALKPYVRAERTRVPREDIAYAPLKLGYRGTVGGLRFDLASTAALKLEYRGEHFQDGPRLRTILAQLSFTFPGMGDDAPSADAGHESHDAPAIPQR